MSPSRLRAYVEFLGRNDLRIAVAALVLFALGIGVAAHLELRSDFTELLPHDDPEVAQLADIERKMGAPANLIIAVAGPEPAANRRFAEAVVGKLKTLVGSELRAIDYRADASKPFFTHNRALYARLVDLQRIDDDLRKAVALKKNPAWLAFADSDKGEVDDDPVADLKLLGKERQGSAGEDLFPSGYYESKDATLLAIVTWTASSGMGDANGFRIRDHVERIIAATGPASFGPVTVALTGDVMSAIAELDALKSDVEWVSVVCILLVLLVVAAYFRSVFALSYVFFPTLLGVALAFAITALVIGYLNTNTAFLGSIVVGNGINFGIILFARYREERLTVARGAPADAMTRAIGATVRPTLGAALAASIAYASLAATSFRGFRQFGFVGGIGMLLCWLATYGYGPALILFGERVRRWPAETRRPDGIMVRVAERLLRQRNILLGGVAGLTVLALGAVVPLARSPFEYDFAKLRNQRSRAHGPGDLYVRVGKIFPRDLAPIGIALLPTADDAAAFGQAVLRQDCADGLTRADSPFARETGMLARECARRVALGEPTGGLLSQVITAASYLPKDQEQKLALIASIRRRLSDPALELLAEGERREIADLAPPADLHRLRASDLPDALAQPLRERDGTTGRVALLFPVRVWRNWDGYALMRMSDVMKNVSLPGGRVASAVGQASIFAAMLRAIAHDGPIATAIAIAATSIMVVVLLRNRRSSLLVLLALATGVVWMGGAAALLHLKLNFLNFVALPITFGIGVDYAINVFARMAADPGPNPARALAETGSAVALCSLTTIIGYSSLLVASNGALVSFGKLAVLGELGCLGAALLLVPALSSSYRSRRHSAWRRVESLPVKIPPRTEVSG